MTQSKIIYSTFSILIMIQLLGCVTTNTQETTYKPTFGFVPPITRDTGQTFVKDPPNPFSPSTEMYFKVEKKQLVTIELYDVLGRKVAELLRDTLAEGKHSVKMDTALTRGVYYLKLMNQSDTLWKKCLFLK